MTSEKRFKSFVQSFQIFSFQSFTRERMCVGRNGWAESVKCFGCKYSLLVMLAYPLIMNKTAHCQQSHQPDVAEPSKMRVRVLRERAGERERERERVESPTAKSDASDYFSQIFFASLSFSLPFSLSHKPTLSVSFVRTPTFGFDWEIPVKLW